jgi:hypothetical protein
LRRPLVRRSFHRTMISQMVNAMAMVRKGEQSPKEKKIMEC